MNYKQYKEIHSDYQKEIDKLHSKKFDLNIDFINIAFKDIFEFLEHIGFEYDEIYLCDVAYSRIHNDNRISVIVSIDVDEFSLSVDRLNDKPLNFFFTNEADFKQIPKILTIIKKEYSIFFRDEKLNRILDVH